MGLSRQSIYDHWNNTFTTRIHKQTKYKIHIYHLPFLHWWSKGTDEPAMLFPPCILALERVARLNITLCVFAKCPPKVRTADRWKCLGEYTMTGHGRFVMVVQKVSRGGPQKIHSMLFLKRRPIFYAIGSSMICKRRSKNPDRQHTGTVADRSSRS
jgi:hypothetical protein